jgi:hypothetical protein
MGILKPSETSPIQARLWNINLLDCLQFCWMFDPELYIGMSVKEASTCVLMGGKYKFILFKYRVHFVRNIVQILCSADYFLFVAQLELFVNYFFPNLKLNLCKYTLKNVYIYFFSFSYSSLYSFQLLWQLLNHRILSFTFLIES